MLISQLHFSAGRWWAEAESEAAARGAQLILVFGDRGLLAQGEFYPTLRERFDGARIVSCSSGGDILGDRSVDGGLIATAIKFSSSWIEAAEADLSSPEDSERVGSTIARRLSPVGLRHVLIFAEGLAVNGSALARGVSSALPSGVTVSGGLAGDGDRFEATLVGLDGVPQPRRVVAVALYGGDLAVGTGSFGGWEPFGPEREITRSNGNVLYEIDGRPALDFYKELLGPLGYALPASGLSFPLQIWRTEDERRLTRTILSVDERARSLTYAGDVPTGWKARLLRTDLDWLIEAAGTAAGQVEKDPAVREHRLALAVSCIGRKLLLQRRTDEELRNVLDVLGPDTYMAGFYSYGELAPAFGFSACDLHNQTMTLTVMGER